MNRTLPHIATRFALFCDPDFYIVHENWIHAVIQHMTERGIGILGVPWHPRWTHKVRYFPCVRCMFVDLELVPVETLDFTPDIDGMPGYARATTADRRNDRRLAAETTRPVEAAPAAPHRQLTGCQLAHPRSLRQ